MESLTIGKVARLAEVGVETIRFYEREGLIEEPSRGESGYRQYPKETIQRLRFIKRAKDLGFTLREIKELLALRLDPGTTCGDVRRRAGPADRLIALSSTCTPGPTGAGPVPVCLRLPLPTMKNAFEGEG